MLGLDRIAPIWEFAAVRVTADGQEVARDEFQIRHDPERGGIDWLNRPDFPAFFREDYKRRYDFRHALTRTEAAELVATIVEGGATVSGSNPAFDMERLGDLLGACGVTPGWYYHPKDIPNVVEGFLLARGELPASPLKSDALSLALGVDPADFARHTAMGDVEWCLAQWRLMKRHNV